MAEFSLDFWVIFLTQFTPKITFQRKVGVIQFFLYLETDQLDLPAPHHTL